MSKNKMEDNSFSALVKEIDKLWGHTYEDLPEESEDEIENTTEEKE